MPQFVNFAVKIVIFQKICQLFKILNFGVQRVAVAEWQNKIDSQLLGNFQVGLAPAPLRGTSLTRKRTPLGLYRRPMPKVLGGS